MEILILGLLLFLGSHSISIINSAWRDRMVARLGLPTWQGLYSLPALGGFILIIWGYGLARQEAVILYQPPPWFAHISLLLMLAVFPLFLAAYLPGRIQAATRHPMLIGTMLWALAHLLANGSLADLLVFGAFLAWTIVDWLSLRHRTGAPVQGAPAGRYNDALAISIGLVIYAVFIVGLHGWLMGVPAIAL